MAGIAGLTKENAFSEVSVMLDRIAHRGNSRRMIIEAEGATMGVCWNDSRPEPFGETEGMVYVRDIAGPGRYATATAHKGRLSLMRDEVGAAPLYEGSLGDNNIAFASEVKALAPETRIIKEVLPFGSEADMSAGKPGSENEREQVTEEPAVVAAKLRQVLQDTVAASLRNNDTGAWLSGGLDSAAITAIASKHIDRIKTFTAGLEGAPDLKYASFAARYLGTDHHEIIVTVEEMMKVLPDVIWHLESFDQLLVRSSILHFIASRVAGDEVSAILTGEGADELFAGYRYLPALPISDLHAELVRITGKLHNTALQRVDRCASSFGMTPLLIFTHPAVMKLALSIPSDYKIVDGEGKWILRKAVEELLPPEITWRSKAKFWEGGGVNERLSEVAEKTISDNDFRIERILPDGLTLSGKEELLYYRIFRELFGEDISHSWMGRSDTVTAVA